MPMQQDSQLPREFQSPGGFVFGVQGWDWGEKRPTSITFMLDGTCTVADQHGRPIKGAVINGKEIYFAKCTHAETIAALVAERIEWQKLACAGWPQVPYVELKKIPELPLTPPEELRKIKDVMLRKDALKMRREMEDARKKEMAAVGDDEE